MVFALRVCFAHVAVVRRPLSDEGSVTGGEMLWHPRRDASAGEGHTVATRSVRCRCLRDAHCTAGMRWTGGGGWMQPIRFLISPICFRGRVLHMQHLLSTCHAVLRHNDWLMI